ncbi:hypothetical protein D3C80_1695870 [compost metagenome]
MRLWLGFIRPAFFGDDLGDPGGHFDKQIIVVATGFQQQDAGLSTADELGCQHATRRACANNDVIEVIF